MSGTSRRSPRHFWTAIFPRKWRRRWQEPELPDLAWKSQMSFSQTSATTDLSPRTRVKIRSEWNYGVGDGQGPRLGGPIGGSCSSFGQARRKSTNINFFGSGRGLSKVFLETLRTGNEDSKRGCSNRPPTNGNSVSTAWMPPKATTKLGLNWLAMSQNFSIDPASEYGHRLRTPFLRRLRTPAARCKTFQHEGLVSLGRSLCEALSPPHSKRKSQPQQWSLVIPKNTPAILLGIRWMKFTTANDGSLHA